MEVTNFLPNMWAYQGSWSVAAIKYLCVCVNSIRVVKMDSFGAICA